MEAETILIVGAGVFGASTAQYLARDFPGTKVTVVDRHALPNPSAASSDWNKIVRSDYDDIFYMKLAMEAHEFWRIDPVFKPFYHEAGTLWAEDMGMGRKTLANYDSLGVKHHAKILTPEEARSRFPVFSAADWTDSKENFHNPESGWGEGDGALKSLVQAAIKAGAVFLEGRVRTLLFDQTRTKCIGIELDDGRQLFADRVVLSAGAYIPQILADSAPDWAELQVDGRMVAAAAVQCKARYDPEEGDRLSKAPVHFNGLWHTHGEMIPPFQGFLKFNCEVSLLNSVFYEGLQQNISIPPSGTTQSTFGQDVPNGLKQELQNIVERTFGNSVKGLEIDSYRMCWDAVTPNQSWIIDSHPHCANLYIAGGGSFHAWKFMPTLGRYVVQMMTGTLDEEKARKWAWDRPNEGAACIMYLPSRDLKDIAPFEGWSKVDVKVAG